MALVVPINNEWIIEVNGETYVRFRWMTEEAFRELCLHGVHIVFLSPLTKTYKEVYTFDRILQDPGIEKSAHTPIVEVHEVTANTICMYIGDVHIRAVLSEFTGSLHLYFECVCTIEKEAITWRW